MILLIASFVAGVLTVAAPCILPLLPVIIGGSIARGGSTDKTSWRKPLIIAASLGISVVLFSLLLKASTILLGIPDSAWRYVSGAIILVIGVTFLWPGLWDKFSARIGLHQKSNKLLGSGYGKKGTAGDIAIGAALGPVFASCSPTYFLIVSAILPASFAQGLLYLTAYALGLAGTLLVIAYLGQAAVKRLGWLANPSGGFYKAVGVLFIIVAFMVILGLDKSIQAYVLEKGWYDPISNLEERLR